MSYVTQPVAVERWKIAAAIVAAFLVGVLFWDQLGATIVCTIDPLQCWSPG